MLLWWWVYNLGYGSWFSFWDAPFIAPGFTITIFSKYRVLFAQWVLLISEKYIFYILTWQYSKMCRLLRRVHRLICYYFLLQRSEGMFDSSPTFLAFRKSRITVILKGPLTLCTFWFNLLPNFPMFPMLTARRIIVLHSLNSL